MVALQVTFSGHFLQCDQGSDKTNNAESSDRKCHSRNRRSLDMNLDRGSGRVQVRSATFAIFCLVRGFDAA
jgi:hypothetical protein